MKLFLRLFVFTLLIGAGIWLWLYFYPSPEEAIRRQLKRLGEAASFDGSESMIARGVAAQNIAGFFGPEVRMNIEPRGLFEEETTRQDISQRVMFFRSLPGIRSFKVQILDPVITMAADKKNAVVEVTVNAESAGERHLFVQELKLTFKEIEGKWLISGVETVRTLNLAPTQFFFARA